MKLTKTMKLVAWSLAVVLAGCGGYVYTNVGGKVTGLTSGTLVLTTDTNYSVRMTSDGNYSFRIASNASYTISVAQQPNPVNCTIVNGSGKMTSDAAVTNVNVTCVPNVQLGGTLTNLPDASTVVLALNDDASYLTTLTANGPFTLAKYAVNGQPFKVSVAVPPVGKVCVVNNGAGTADIAAPATNIGVNCVTGVPIGGTVSGLKANTLLVLNNNNSETINVLADGIVSFKFSLLDGASYDVQVTTQPTGQKCTVNNGKGIASLANPTPASSISITCVAA